MVVGDDGFKRRTDLIEPGPPRHHDHVAARLDPALEQAAFGQSPGLGSQASTVLLRAEADRVRPMAVELLEDLLRPAAADQRPARLVGRARVENTGEPGQFLDRCPAYQPGWTLIGGRSSSKATACRAMSTSLAGCGGTT